jgi:hypothetical protein
MEEERQILGRYTAEDLDTFIKHASLTTDIGEKIDYLSRQFLGIDYRENTLSGNSNKEELFVINFREVDCLTFLESVAALSLSRTFSEFKELLKKVRYHSGAVAFENRNHFFTDWTAYNADFFHDITLLIGESETAVIEKIVNEKADGTLFIPGIQPIKRRIVYLPSIKVNSRVLQKMRTGDYIGIYSGESGLDVSHVGIFIREKDSFFLRHASSSEARRKVIDEDFGTYIYGKPGIIVLRDKRVA